MGGHHRSKSDPEKTFTAGSYNKKASLFYEAFLLRLI